MARVARKTCPMCGGPRRPIEENRGSICAPCHLVRSRELERKRKQAKPKTCRACGDEFYGRANQHFCSPECKDGREKITGPIPASYFKPWADASWIEEAA